MEDIGKRIRQMRLDRGLTLRQAARLAGIPPSTFSNIESKHRTLTLENLLRIAAAFQVSPSLLLSGEGQPTEEKVSPRDRLVYEYEGMRAELLTRRAGESDLHVFLLTYQAGVRQPWAEPHHGWEYLYLLEGRVEMLIEGEEPIRLQRGDFFCFCADRRHSVHALERSVVILIGFGTGFLPGYRRAHLLRSGEG